MGQGCMGPSWVAAEAREASEEELVRGGGALLPQVEFSCRREGHVKGLPLERGWNCAVKQF